MSQPEAPEPEREQVLDEQRRQRDHQRHMQQLQFNEEGQLSREFLESMIDTSTLQAKTLTKLRNYLSRQWMLSNLNEAEAHDQRWKLEVMKIKIMGMHPPDDSVITGATRAFLLDDEAEELDPIGAAERVEIDALFDTLKALITRSRGGFERVQLNTEVRESKTESRTPTGDEPGGLRGLFN